MQRYGRIALSMTNNRWTRIWEEMEQAEGRIKERESGTFEQNVDEKN